MNQPITVLGIAGSLRRQSYNRFALRAAQELAAEGMTIDAFELDGIPGFNEDEEKNPPAKIVEFKKRIRAADAILFVTPEYNYSVPGVLKNAIDWASRPYGDSAWAGKPAAIMGTSIGNIATARAISSSPNLCLSKRIPAEPAGGDDRKCFAAFRRERESHGRIDQTAYSQIIGKSRELDPSASAIGG
jgi:NAD(P)H-dependent FMN reductase